MNCKNEFYCKITKMKKWKKSYNKNQKISLLSSLIKFMNCKNKFHCEITKIKKIKFMNCKNKFVYKMRKSKYWKWKSIKKVKKSHKYQKKIKNCHFRKTISFQFQIFKIRNKNLWVQKVKWIIRITFLKVKNKNNPNYKNKNRNKLF